ncbi:MAG: fluoride efflux transporter CrcB [Methylophaga nitratireducenticrescens]|uniref:fluoride efflux transporter CrcB n=1 Tax=Methylophaga sp. SB9B TaxID=2570356 RepID=UPI0010A89B10|nr:fluoride efflux transporter CrcB [Methylophaga sp. SB9B]THF72971.1 MAG: fluoride efflux transporter CrcB [Methylophaga nitratireducenticrescens]THK40879.1 fluoride efflux transporter CrcB [Methylophaga sp. SB9B]
MLQIFAIAVGGAAGALLRFFMSNGVYKMLGRDFPYGTLAVNVLGSLLIGVLFILLIEKLAVAAEWRAGLMVGLLGAFTTFSTFSLETFSLLEDGAFLKAGLNVFLSVVLCLAATWVGISLGRQL